MLSSFARVCAQLKLISTSHGCYQFFDDADQPNYQGSPMLGRVSDEEIIEAAVRVLLSQEQDMRALVLLLVANWPQASALQVITALAMAAGTVEHMLANQETKRRAQDCWRMAGLVGVDLWMMNCMGLPTDTAADLMAYWLAYDRFFLS